MHEEKALWRMPRVIEALGVQKSTLWERVKTGHLPPPVRISARSVAWPSNEIIKIIDAQIAGCNGDALAAFVSDLVAARPKWP
jgi:predicted DNA-binding transcriptional regulator AlpA